MSLTVQKLRVKSITYSEGEIKSQEKELKLSLSCSDSLSIKGSTDNWTSFYFTRNIDITPEPVFSLSVTIFVIVADPAKKDSVPTESEILAELRKKDNSLSALFAEVSLLVSLVTKANGDFPMITPPVFMEKAPQAQKNK
jgi:hypothetical protein